MVISANAPVDAIYDQKQPFMVFRDLTNATSIVVEGVTEQVLSDADRPLKIADLGCYDGDNTVRILAALGSALGANVHASYQIVGSDPSEEGIRAFRDRDLPQDITFSFKTLNHRDFLAQNTETFDWIWAIHSLYWEENLAQTIQDMQAVCKNLLVVMRGELFTYRFQNDLCDCYQDLPNPAPQAEHLEKILHNFGFKYTQISKTVTIRVPKDEQQFQALVEFLFHVPLSALKPGTLAKVKDYLAPYGGTLPHDYVFFTIQGQQT